MFICNQYKRDKHKTIKQQQHYITYVNCLALVVFNQFFDFRNILRRNGRQSKRHIVQSVNGHTTKKSGHVGYLSTTGELNIFEITIIWMQYLITFKHRTIVYTYEPRAPKWRHISISLYSLSYWRTATCGSSASAARSAPDTWLTRTPRPTRTRTCAWASSACSWQSARPYWSTPALHRPSTRWVFRIDTYLSSSILFDI